MSLRSCDGEHTYQAGGQGRGGSRPVVQRRSDRQAKETADRRGAADNRSGAGPTRSNGVVSNDGEATPATASLVGCRVLKPDHEPNSWSSSWRDRVWMCRPERSSTSIWTRSTRRSNNATTQSSEVAPSPAPAPSPIGQSGIVDATRRPMLPDRPLIASRQPPADHLGEPRFPRVVRPSCWRTLPVRGEWRACPRHYNQQRRGVSPAAIA